MIDPAFDVSTNTASSVIAARSFAEPAILMIVSSSSNHASEIPSYSGSLSLRYDEDSAIDATYLRTSGIARITAACWYSQYSPNRSTLSSCLRLKKLNVLTIQGASALDATDPLFEFWRCVRFEAVKQSVGAGLDDQHCAMLGAEKPLFDGVVEERDQIRVEAVDVEQSRRVVVLAELRPGQHLGHFIERAGPARKRNEAVGQLGHQRFSFSHRTHDAQVRQSTMRNFVADEGIGNHADDFAARLQHRVREYAHQADARAAVHESKSSRDEGLAEFDRGLSVRGRAARTRAAKNAKPPHAINSLLCPVPARRRPGPARARPCCRKRRSAPVP